MQEKFNLLEDCFDKDLVDLSMQFQKLLKESNQVPLIVFDGENNYENSIVLGEPNIDYMSIKSIYEQLENYPLKRPPFFYMSQADIYWPSTGGSHHTYIIFTQDGVICNHWAKQSEPLLIPWNAFSGLKKTHDPEVDFDCIHLLQGNGGIEIYINATTGSVKSGNHDEAQLLTNFGYSVLETMWTYIEKNRNEPYDSFPIELWYWILKFEDVKNKLGSKKIKPKTKPKKKPKAKPKAKAASKTKSSAIKKEPAVKKETKKSTVELGKTPAWQKIKAAMESFGTDYVASYKEIMNYCNEHYGEVKDSTFRTYIISCTVNHDTRVHYSPNKKPRTEIVDNDVLFQVEKGKVVLYNPEKHGDWHIKLGDDGKLHPVKS